MTQGVYVTAGHEHASTAASIACRSSLSSMAKSFRLLASLAVADGMMEEEGGSRPRQCEDAASHTSHVASASQTALHSTIGDRRSAFGVRRLRKGQMIPEFLEASRFHTASTSS